MTPRFARAALLLAALGCGGAGQDRDISPPPAADLVVFGRVWTGDSAAPWAGAVAVTGDSLVAVGDSAPLGADVGAATRVLDNGTSLVTPRPSAACQGQRGL